MHPPSSPLAYPAVAMLLLTIAAGPWAGLRLWPRGSVKVAAGLFSLFAVLGVLSFAGSVIPAPVPRLVLGYAACQCFVLTVWALYGLDSRSDWDDGDGGRDDDEPDEPDDGPVFDWEQFERQLRDYQNERDGADNSKRTPLPV